jgi:hypothetical protein
MASNVFTAGSKVVAKLIFKLITKFQLMMEVPMTLTIWLLPALNAMVAKVNVVCVNLNKA